MYCPNCKQEFDGKFCPECGTKLIDKTTRMCPKCNIEVDCNFCPECGTKIVEVVEKIVKMCPNCNIESDSKFCPECGSKIEEMAVKATATGEIVAAGQQEEKAIVEESTGNTTAATNKIDECANKIKGHLHELGMDEFVLYTYDYCGDLEWNEHFESLDSAVSLDLYFDLHDSYNGQERTFIAPRKIKVDGDDLLIDMEEVKEDNEGEEEVLGYYESLSVDALLERFETSDVEKCFTEILTHTFNSDVISLNQSEEEEIMEKYDDDAETYYRTAEDYYWGRNGKTQDYAEAVKWYRKAAEQGHAKALYSLGYCYEWGEGVDTDEDEAIEWYLKAAELGHLESQAPLGRLLWHTNREDEAVPWLLKASERGVANAQGILGYCYERGHGVYKDKNEAIKWYKKAAAQGDEFAIECLEELDE